METAPGALLRSASTAANSSGFCLVPPPRSPGPCCPCRQAIRYPCVSVLGSRARGHPSAGTQGHLGEPGVLECLLEPLRVDAQCSGGVLPGHRKAPLLRYVRRRGRDPRRRVATSRGLSLLSVAATGRRSRSSLHSGRSAGRCSPRSARYSPSLPHRSGTRHRRFRVWRCHPGPDGQGQRPGQH